MKLILFLFGWALSAASFCQNPTPYVLLVGVQRVDHDRYGDKYSEAATAGAKSDIDNIKYMLGKSEFDDKKISVLFTEQATRQRVLDSLKSIAEKAKNKNDLIIFYFTGHGDRLKDVNGDEADGKDEVLVCYDELLLDDDLNRIWVTINPKVRILMMVDACHSGTTYKMLDHRVNFKADTKLAKFKTELAFEKSFSGISGPTETYSEKDEPYQMIYIAAAKDPDETTGGLSSQFTSELLAVFNLYQNNKQGWRELRYKTYLQQVAGAIRDQEIVYAEVGKCSTILNDYPYQIKPQ